MKRIQLHTQSSRGPLRGFTLVEIMLVVIIIGIIAAIIVPRFAGKLGKAKAVTAKSNIAAISTAIDMFELDVGRFPTTDEGLDALLAEPASLDADSDWDRYMREIPRDPWGREYRYRSPGEFTIDYDVWSLGADGQEGTDDDIANVELD